MNFLLVVIGIFLLSVISVSSLVVPQKVYNYFKENPKFMESHYFRWYVEKRGIWGIRFVGVWTGIMLIFLLFAVFGKGGIFNP